MRRLTTCLKYSIRRKFKPTYVSPPNTKKKKKKNERERGGRKRERERERERKGWGEREREREREKNCNRSLQKILEENLCLIIPHVPLTNHSTKGMN